MFNICSDVGLRLMIYFLDSGRRKKKYAVKLCRARKEALIIKKMVGRVGFNDLSSTFGKTKNRSPRARSNQLPAKSVFLRDENILCPCRLAYGKIM